ncbi:hypothetical protein [Streptomyces sp900129855]|uniref:Uncharacterized protein n=1 Tax=Streptomyces sp. 900129855 TaxID=3155129 RepID=A0ABV2ZZ34_9ACTN
MARTAAGLPAPRVTLVRSLTVENVDSIGFVVRRWTQCSAGHRALQELPLLVGAGGFRADSALAKARADVGGLLYADGIHDSLLRSAVRTLTTPAPVETPRLKPPADPDNLRHPAPA